ncbi:MAG TPA: hypothetical protein VJK07_01125 [Candidatus Nanoarchaeia archaeon]|nr:hypothetical protein [Candidatus Nanoarchaeia archaeon]
MEKTFIGVRDVDTETFRKFRARAIAQKLKLGEAITQAMKEVLGKKEKTKKRNGALFNIKPFSWGKGTENTSKSIDEIVYLNKK